MILVSVIILKMFLKLISAKQLSFRHPPLLRDVFQPIKEIMNDKNTYKNGAQY